MSDKEGDLFFSGLAVVRFEVQRGCKTPELATIQVLYLPPREVLRTYLMGLSVSLDRAVCPSPQLTSSIYGFYLEHFLGGQQGPAVCLAQVRILTPTAKLARPSTLEIQRASTRSILQLPSSIIIKSVSLNRWNGHT